MPEDEGGSRTWVYTSKPHRLVGFDYADTDHPYFVTTCAVARLPRFKDERLARIVIDSLEYLRSEDVLRLYSYCLMPNHLHLLLQLTGAKSLGQVMRDFKSFTSRQSWPIGYKGALWQARFYNHIVRSRTKGLAIAKYIYENPVRSGLVADPDDYPWSGQPDPM